MASLQLVPIGKPMSELVMTKIADLLLVAGRAIHGRYAAIPAGQVDETLGRLERWSAHLQAFVTWAAPLDFSRNRVLAAGICSRPAFDVYMGLLKRMGVVVVYPKSGTAWAHGWDKRRLLVMLRRRMIDAPYPIEGEPPRVLHTRVLESKMAQPSQPANLGSVVYARDVASGRR